MHASTDFYCLLGRVKRPETLGWITLPRMCKHLKDPRVDQSGCYSTECDESGASISMIEVFPNRKSGTSRMDDALKDKEEPLLSEIDDTLGRSTASQPGQQINKGKYYCIMDKLSGKNESQKTFGSSQNLREFVSFDSFLEIAIRDDYRYLWFTCTL